MRFVSPAALLLYTLAVGTATTVQGNNDNGNGIRGNRKLRPANGKKIKDSYIIVLDDDTTEDDVDVKARGFLKQVGGKQKGRSIKKVLKGFSAQMTQGQAIAMSKKQGVKYVEEDAEVHAVAVASWGLDRIDQEDLPLDSTYDAGYGPTGGAGTVVYVIDTGIRPTHVQFGDRASTGAEYDFINDGQDGIDCDGHGTHCSGTVAGSTYGVAPGAHIIGVRVLGCNGSGSTSGVVAGMDKVASDCGPGGTVKAGLPHAGKRCVASMSLGGGFSTTSNNAIANLRNNAGVVVAVAAGNDNAADACNYSPASAPAAITVASSTSSDARSSFSNIGSCVDIFAPGSGITSATSDSDTSSGTWSGTSMATPHVAGVAALIYGANPTFTAQQVEDEMLADAWTGKISDAGAGSPNLLLYADRGACTSSAECVNSNPCTTGTCNAGICEYSNNNDPCDDGDVCTINDTCSGGTCAGNLEVGKSCDDGDVCTTNDSCDASGQCAGTWDCPDVAQYNPSYGAPACLAEGLQCDSGSLLEGRGTLGPEANYPNAHGCADKTSGTYQNDESMEKLKVSSLDGLDLTVGQPFKIEATVWAWGTGSSDACDFYYSDNANSPTWQYLGTIVPSAGGEQLLTMIPSIDLSNTPGLHRVRANFRYSGSASSCSTNSWDEADDLVFAVAASGPPPPTVSPTNTPTASPTSAPTNAPTDAPTNAPTSAPTKAPLPTQAPTSAPTSAPTNAPTSTPTSVPTSSPSSVPSLSLTPTSAPTESPTRSPTNAPTSFPTSKPTTAAPTASGPLDFSDFESGWDGWQDGGRNSRRSINDAAFCTSGSYCIRLRDDTSTSTMTKTFTGIDFAQYGEVQVEFGYYTRRMDNNDNEGFVLECNNGNGWIVVGNWRVGTDFNNGQEKVGTTQIQPGAVNSGSSTFNTSLSLRFRNDASRGNEHVYIDDVKVTGVSN